MISPKKNPTRNEPKNQRAFGRVPVDLEPTLARLTHLEAHLYLILTIHAIRKERHPKVGCVNISKSELARHMDIDPKSVRVAAKGLFAAGVLTEGKAECPTSWGVMPYYVGDESPPQGIIPHPLGDNPLPPGGSSPGKSTQPQQNTDTYPLRIRSEDVSEDVTTVVAADLPSKKKTRRAPSWLIWDPNREVLTTRNGDTSGNEEFMKRWKERLGEEDIIWVEKEAAEKWLRENPEKRIKVKRFDMFFGKWLEKRWEAS